MKRLKNCIIILLIPFTTGCATVALTALSGVGFAVHYSQSNVASKTFTFPMDQADKATMSALQKMSIKVVVDNRTKKGKRIKAATDELDIIIDLEQVTAMVTKINVDARKGPVLKDKATAGEIIAQVSKALEVKKNPGELSDILTHWEKENIYPQNKKSHP